MTGALAQGRARHFLSRLRGPISATSPSVIGLSRRQCQTFATLKKSIAPGSVLQRARANGQSAELRAQGGWEWTHKKLSTLRTKEKPRRGGSLRGFANRIIA